MRKKEIEKRLQQAISDKVPDVLDNILAQCKEVEGMETMKSKNKEKNGSPASPASPEKPSCITGGPFGGSTAPL